MTARPIRGDVFVACEWEVEPEKATLRQALEWWKRAQQIMLHMVETYGSLTAAESRYVNERWAALCRAVAEREGVPAGALSYFLGELAGAEMRALEVAKNATLE